MNSDLIQGQVYYETHYQVCGIINKGCLELNICFKQSFVILTIPLGDSLTFQLYRLHDLPLLHLTVQRSFQYDLHHKNLAVRSDVKYITFPEDDDIISF